MNGPFGISERIITDRARRKCRTWSLLAFLVIGSLAPTASARICSSLGNGDWNQPSTWSCGSVPTGGDTVIVQAGHTVMVTNNYNYSGAPLQVMVHGVLQFNGGGSKLSLPCGSFVEIMPGGAVLPDPQYNGFSETVRICNTTYWNTTMGPQYGYQIWPTPIPLPVELLSFSGSSDGMRVNLEWVTGSERDALYFELHRSLGLHDRSLVELVPAQGSGHVPIQYRVIDRPQDEGTLYYHLRERTTDGSAKDIGTVAVHHRSMGPGVTCAPNPLGRRDPLTVTVPPSASALDVHMADPTGRWVRPIFLEEEGRLTVLFDGQSASPGIYTLQVIEAGQVLGTCRFRMDR